MIPHLTISAPCNITAKTDTLWDFVGNSTLLSIFAIIIIGLFFYTFCRQNWFWKWVKSSLTYFFVLIWLAGFIIYDIGLYPNDASNTFDEIRSLLAVTPMAALHAFKMFILESDVSAVHDECFKSTLYMSLFAFVHFLAALISLAFVIKHFGYNILAGSRMSWHSRFGNREKLFVFWGMSDATYQLAKSIDDALKPGSKQEKKNYNIVIVRAHSDQDTTSERNGMERLFNFLSLKNKDLDRLQDLRCLTTNSFESPALLNIPEEAILEKQLRLRALSRMIRSRRTKEVHFFFLSDDETENIQSVANLKRDKTLIDILPKEGSTEKKKVLLYCHARYNSVHRVIEDEQLNSNMEVKVIDSSHINVELLKQKTDQLPINFVKVEDDATVSTPFNALVIGFGEVGLDSVRFLYEFGAFVKSGSTDQEVVRSDFHCDVVDKNMSALAGIFVANAPAIKPTLLTWKCERICKEISKTDKALITLHEMDIQSAAFYEQLEEWIKKLNYVLIATENDEENISLAIRIFRLAIRYRQDMEQFCIMVRIKNDEDGHFTRMKDHYNQLLQAKSGPIYLFGQEKEAYTYDNIVDQAIEKEAKEFYRVYKEGYGDWDQRHKQFMLAPTYAGILSLRRQERQDFANSMHKATKRKLFEEALNNQKLSEGSIKRQDKKIKKVGTDDEELQEIRYYGQDDKPVAPNLRRIIDVLAQTEHLRWNASHEILGYQYAPKKDEARMLHNCLTDWQDLTLDYQNYDYNVVDVSLDEIETPVLQRDKDAKDRFKKLQ